VGLGDTACHTGPVWQRFLNGRSSPVDGDARSGPLTVLRDHLDLTGRKDGKLKTPALGAVPVLRHYFGGEFVALAHMVLKYE
jgi:hypothetical protein